MNLLYISRLNNSIYLKYDAKEVCYIYIYIYIYIEKAKEIASRLPRHMQKDWHSIKIGVMEEVLSQKITSCDEFKNSLINSGNKRLVEAVKSDRYWSCGLNPKEASTTKSEYYLGENIFGLLLEHVRSTLIEKLNTPNIVNHDANLDTASTPDVSSPQPRTYSRSQSPSPPPHPSRSIPSASLPSTIDAVKSNIFFYLSTLDKLFLKVCFQTENARIYIIMIVYVIDYTCLIIILCTCGMALLLYTCIVYVECACLIGVYMVEPEESIGSERRRWFPLQTMFSCVWGCDISVTFSCVIYIYMKHKHVYILIFFHTTILCKQK